MDVCSQSSLLQPSWGSLGIVPDSLHANSTVSKLFGSSGMLVSIMLPAAIRRWANGCCGMRALTTTAALAAAPAVGVLGRVGVCRARPAEAAAGTAERSPRAPRGLEPRGRDS